ncbi:MAG: TRIC cation channel family protein [Ignavibacteria bacterium]|nr:TRIC cation channel family protein [Ignavibacteria bacterium]
MIDTFSLPVWWDLTATFLYALVGTRFAIMRGYDVVGVLMISLIVSVGGACCATSSFKPGRR